MPSVSFWLPFTGFNGIITRQTQWESAVVSKMVTDMLQGMLGDGVNLVYCEQTQHCVKQTPLLNPKLD